MDISALKRDSKQVEAGTWINDIPSMGDLRLRVRGMSSPTVAALRARKERKATREEREPDGRLKADVALRIFGEVLHEAVLLEWDGLTQEGRPLPYDPELAKKWLTDPDYLPFADAVTYAAGVVDRGFAATKEDVVGKSKKSSGDSSTATT